MLSNNEPLEIRQRMIVPIERVAAYQDLMMRTELPEATVQAYASIIQQSAFPPLECAQIAGEPELLLFNGFIRYEAWKRCQAAQVEVVIYPVDTRDDAVLLAVKSDSYTGLKRTNKDKQRAVELLLATDKYRDMAATDVANAAGVNETSVRNFRNKQLSIRNSDSDSPKTVKTRRGNRPRKYKKRRGRTSGVVTPPPPPVQWPTREETGAPSPEIMNEPHPDYPGMTYAQVFVQQHGFVQLVPPDKKRKQENIINTRNVISHIRDIGAICQKIMTIMPPKLSIADFAATLTEINQGTVIWSRKLNQHRIELDVALPLILQLLDATRKSDEPDRE
jgi:hypothetical protein